MAIEANDLSKQLGQYADGIAAFSIIQFIGFTFNLSHGDCFTANVMESPLLAMIAGAVINAAYLGLVFLCRSGQKRLGTGAHSGTDGSAIGIQKNIWLARILSIGVVLILTVAVVAWAWWNNNRGHFHMSCK
jgi:hypothetical protein